MAIRKVYLRNWQLPILCRQVQTHFMYGTLEVLGPEHEFSIIDENLTPLPIVDKVIRNVHGRVVNCTSLGTSSFGKELQAHVAEFKANTPFASPVAFEETMQKAVDTILGVLEDRYNARLLGLGMHPLLRLSDAEIWSHRDRGIYAAMSKIFNLKQHGWLNIQSFQLNLPYANESEGVRLHNAVTNILPYLPAVAASSPIYECKIGALNDNRLKFYLENQLEAPSITGSLIPDYVKSFKEYNIATVHKYSEELAKLNAPPCLLNKEWLNSRGAVFRHDRKAIEIRIMDEQESIKADVALSCFIRAASRGILDNDEYPYLSHDVLVHNFKQVVGKGLQASVKHPEGKTAREVCLHLFRIAFSNATEEERKYLSIIKQRIEGGNLSDTIIRNVAQKAQKTDLEEAIISVYLHLADCLEKNKVCVN